MYKIIEFAYADDVMSCARVFEWFLRFQDGRQSIKDDERSCSSRYEENGHCQVFTVTGALYRDAASIFETNAPCKTRFAEQ